MTLFVLSVAGVICYTADLTILGHMCAATILVRVVGADLIEHYLDRKWQILTNIKESHE